MGAHDLDAEWRIGNVDHAVEKAERSRDEYGTVWGLIAVARGLQAIAAAISEGNKKKD